MKVTKFKEVNKGALFAVLSLDDPHAPYIVNDIKIFRKGNSQWLQMPSREYEAEGEKKYFPYNQFRSKEDKEAYSLKILQAVKEFLSNQPTLDEVPF